MTRAEWTQRERTLSLALLASDPKVEIGRRLWAVWMLGEMAAAPRRLRTINT